MFTKFPPSPPVVSTLVLSARLAAQCQSKIEQHDANVGSTFGTQEDNLYPPQWQKIDKRPLNTPTYKTYYQDFAPLKHAMESVFVESW